MSARHETIRARPEACMLTEAAKSVGRAGEPPPAPSGLADAAPSRLAQSVEALSDSFILWDADDRMLLANSAAVRLGRRRGGERWPNVRVLYTSGYSDEFISRERAAVAANIIGKPYSRAQLDAALREALAARGGGPEDRDAKAAAG
jgi:hypothetical protein